MLLRTEQPARPQRLLVRHAAQPVAQRVEAVGRVADAKLLDSLVRKPATGKVFARQRPAGPAQLLLKPRRGRLVQFQQLGPQPGSGSLFRRRKLPLGQRNPALLRHNPHRLGKADILDLARQS